AGERGRLAGAGIQHLPRRHRHRAEAGAELPARPLRDARPPRRPGGGPSYSFRPARPGSRGAETPLRSLALAGGPCMTEVFLCRGKRSPVGRHGGALARLRPDDMAAQVIDGLLGADDLPVDEVILGCANQAGEDNRNVARMAVLLSRLPVTVPGLTVNRLCASGLDAVIAGARAIATGGADLVIAGGVESMSRAP